MSHDPPPVSNFKPALIVVMGTSGSGKSTLGSQLSEALLLPFIDGDDLHPSSNVDKMSRGQPLTDSDREPWLQRIRSTAFKLTEPSVESRRLAEGLRTGSAEEKERILGLFRDVQQQDVKGTRQLAEVFETSSTAKSEGTGELAHETTLQPAPAEAEVGREPRRACVIACSALKRSYRQLLRGNIPDLASYNSSAPQTAELQAAPPDMDVYHVYMDISADILLDRMKNRQNHWMKESMLRSQLETLEPPVDLHGSTDGETVDAEPGIVVVPVEKHTTIPEVTKRATQRLLAMVGPMQ